MTLDRAAGATDRGSGLSAARPGPTPAGLSLSQVLDKPVLDTQGERLAAVQDLVVRFGGEPHPPISGLVARQGRRRFYLDWAQVAELSPRGVRLGTYTVNLRPFARRDGEALLRRDILDKQLIDVDGRRVVRANDLQLAAVAGQYRLVGVDVSGQALLRRLGPAALASRIAGRRFIDWAEVESFATDVPRVRLRVPHHGVARLHPVEIAHLVDALSARQGQELLAALDDETAADTMQELAPDDAAELLEGLDRGRAADILDEMDPDDAADVLAEMPEAQAEELLGLMEPEESADVRELLAYDEDSAGGLMTTAVVTLPQGLTAGEALARLRALAEPPAALYHLYLVAAGGSERLVGVVPLRDLALAAPDTPLAALAQPELRTVRADERLREVARVMAEYNLPDLPVVDDEGRLLGIVLIDDAIDAFYPDLWRRRLSEVFR